MTERAWARIDEADRGTLLEAAAEMQAFLFDEVPRQDEEAVAEMQKRGLTVSTVGEPEVALLRAIVDTLAATWRGTASRRTSTTRRSPPAARSGRTEGLAPELQARR